jgi:hypothetical protein
VHLGTPQTVADFFKKERWHGRDVFKLFLTSGRSLNVVLFALFYVASFAGLVAGLIMAITYNLYFPLGILVFAMLSLPAALALKNIRRFGDYKNTINLGALYLVYGVARALCIIDLSSWAIAGRRQAGYIAEREN